MKKLLTIEQEKIVIDDYLTYKLSTCKIALKFKTDARLIRNVLLRNNVILRKNTENSKKYLINENYFDKIDTYEKAYFLGLLFADGNVSKKTNCVTISLKETDSYILQYFIDEIYRNKKLEIIPSKKIYFKNKLVDRKEQRKLSITNQRIGEKLINLGLIPNKTHVLTFPNINKEYFSSFILGYFDGDGCIFKSKKIKSNILINFAGNEYFLNQIQEIFINELKLNQTKINNTSNIFYLRYSGKNNIKKIHDFMYKNSKIYLIRKKEKFDEILQ